MNNNKDKNGVEFDIPTKSNPKDDKTPKPSTILSTKHSRIEDQLLLLMMLCNLLLLGSITALFLKLGWSALLAIAAVL